LAFDNVMINIGELKLILDDASATVNKKTIPITRLANS